MNMQIAGRYEIIDQIGSGGMGTIHLVLDTYSGMLLALKIAIETSDSNLSRLQREIDILKEISHPSIVKFFDSGIDNNKPFYVMEFIPGKPINEISDELGPTIGFIKQVADALSFLHARGIIHRDIKPENILISGNRAILVDFGIAQSAYLTRMTNAGSFIGTISYMSPEQLHGQAIDNRADLYSIGSVLYEIVTGHNVFEGNNILEIIYRAVNSTPAPPSSFNQRITKPLEAIIMKLLEKNPENRYRTADDLISDLNALDTGNQLTRKVTPRIDFAYIPFIGRKDLLNSFKNILNRAKEGIQNNVIVCGQSGVGKSRLVQEFKSLALLEEAIFVICDPAASKAGTPAISTLLDQISSYKITFDKPFSDSIAYALRELSPEFALKQPILHDYSPKTISNLPEMLGYFISSIEAETPIIMAFEDNLDEFTAQTLKYIFKYLKNKKNIVIQIVNDESATISHSSAEKILMKVNNLTQSELIELSECVCSKKLTPSEYDMLMERTQGNPLFILSILKQREKEGTSISLSRLPKDVVTLYLESLSRISDKAQVIIKKISMVREPLTYSMLAPICGIDNNDIEKIIKEIQSTNLVSERIVGLNNYISIISKVMADSIVESVSPEERRRYNQELALSFELYYESPNPQQIAEIGRHYVLGGEESKGIKIILDVITALRQSQNIDLILEYLLFLEPFISKTENNSFKVAYLLFKVDVFIMKGMISNCFKLLPDLEKLYDSNEVTNTSKVDLLMAMCNLFIVIPDIKSIISCLEKASCMLTDASESALAKYYHFKCASEIETNNLDKALESADMELVHSLLVDKSATINAYAMISAVLGKKQEFVLALSNFDKAICLAREINNVSIETYLMINKSSLLFESNQIDTAMNILEEAIEKTLKTKNYRGFSKAIIKYIDNSFLLENFKKVREYSSIAYATFKETETTINKAFILTVKSAFALWDLDYEEFVESIKEQRHDSLATKDVRSLAQGIHLHSIALLFQGNYDQTNELLEEFINLETLKNSPFYSMLLSASVLSYSLQGRLDEAKKAIAELVNAVNEDDAESNYHTIIAKCFYSSSLLEQSNGKSSMLSCHSDLEDLSILLEKTIHFLNTFLEPHNHYFWVLYTPLITIAYLKLITAMENSKLLTSSKEIQDETTLELINRTKNYMESKGFKWLLFELDAYSNRINHQRFFNY